MIGDIFCKDNKDRIKYQTDRLNLAKKRIRDFPTLSSIFHNFEDYQTLLDGDKTIPSNVVFNLISTKYYEDVYTPNNLLQSSGTINSIKKLENALRQFFVYNAEKHKEYLEFCKRLTDNDNFTSTQALNEIVIAYDIAKKIGFNNVSLHYESINGKKPDLHIILGNKSIFLELTALETRVPEKKIKEIATSIANYVLTKSKKKSYLISILFDTMIVTPFKDEKGHIVVKNAVTYLKEMIDRLHLEELIGLNGSVDFHDRKIHLYQEESSSVVKDKSIIHIDSELDKNKSLLDTFSIKGLNKDKRNKNESNEILNDYELVKSWANKVILSDFLNSPFDTIDFSSGGDNECVYINSLDFDSNSPSLNNSYLVSTSQIAKTSFIDHIKRRIDDKVERAQFENNFPFVIGIEAFQWQFEYEYDYEDFIPLRNEIETHLKKYSQVSGIILFASDIYRGRFIENPNANKKVNKNDLESSHILYKHLEPRWTHDRKVILSGMDYDEKVKRMIELIKEEKNLNVTNSSDISGYMREDLEEMLKNLHDLLGESKIEDDILSLVEPVIKKYCQFHSENEDTEHSNAPITEDRIYSFDIEPIRAYSAACLMRFNWHSPDPDNIKIINSLSIDSSSHVREAICRELPYFYDKNSQNTLSIATKYCDDNKFVRWNLRDFLKYLISKDRTQALQLFCLIINKYGNSNFQDGEGILIDYVVSEITRLSLLLKDPRYVEALEELIGNPNYSSDLKKRIITTMRDKEFLQDSLLLDRVAHYYLNLFDQNSFEVKLSIEFFLLYQLQENIFLFPEIKLLLDKISMIRYPGTIGDLMQSPHYTFLDYIHKFFDSFPQEATIYFLKIIELNEFLLNSFKTSVIIRILGKIFDSHLEKHKKQAKMILDKIDSNKHWRARGLAEKVFDSSKVIVPSRNPTFIRIFFKCLYFCIQKRSYFTSTFYFS